MGNVIGLLKLRARLHDLCILDAVSDPAVMLRDYIEAVLFESGRSVIVVPAHVPDFSLDRIVVAWDGSAQAARALNDSLPLLRAAGTIEVVCVAGDSEMSKTMPGSDIAPHLVRHGLNVDIVELPMGPSDAASTMMAYAGNVAADLIVMGAYRHSRLQEWVLGGMTRSLLSSPPAPLFIAH